MLNRFWKFLGYPTPEEKPATKPAEENKNTPPPQTPPNAEETENPLATAQIQPSEEPPLPVKDEHEIFEEKPKKSLFDHKNLFEDDEDATFNFTKTMSKKPSLFSDEETPKPKEEKKEKEKPKSATDFLNEIEEPSKVEAPKPKSTFTSSAAPSKPKTSLFDDEEMFSDFVDIEAEEKKKKEEQERQKKIEEQNQKLKEEEAKKKAEEEKKKKQEEEIRKKEEDRKKNINLLFETEHVSIEETLKKMEEEKKRKEEESLKSADDFLNSLKKETERNINQVKQKEKKKSEIFNFLEEPNQEEQNKKEAEKRKEEEEKKQKEEAERKKKEEEEKAKAEAEKKKKEEEEKKQKEEAERKKKEEEEKKQKEEAERKKKEEEKAKAETERKKKEEEEKKQMEVKTETQIENKSKEETEEESEDQTAHLEHLTKRRARSKSLRLPSRRSFKDGIRESFQFEDLRDPFEVCGTKASNRGSVIGMQFTPPTSNEETSEQPQPGAPVPSPVRKLPPGAVPLPGVGGPQLPKLPPGAVPLPGRGMPPPGAVPLPGIGGFNPADIRNQLKKTPAKTTENATPLIPPQRKPLSRASTTGSMASDYQKGIDDLFQWAKKCCASHGIQLTNFTTDFGDGLAFCAIVNHSRPGTIDFASLKKENKMENLKIAFDAATKLGVVSLLDPEDVANLAVPDRKSIITYVSEMYKVLRS